MKPDMMVKQHDDRERRTEGRSQNNLRKEFGISTTGEKDLMKQYENVLKRDSVSFSPCYVHFFNSDAF
jgi:hypothetical protein